MRFMRCRFVILALAALAVAGPLAAEPAGRYVPGTEDVPLMPGLSAVIDAGMVFDKPQGRIVQASAKGALKRADVLAFYATSLPALGWSRAGDRSFERDGERLSLDFSGADGQLVVGFTLAPH
jgi:hypothetical protein